MQIPILIVEQNLKFAKKLADQFVVIQKGEIVASGATSELSDEIIHNYLTV
jgi:urea transport system ATP-binding protein